MELAAMVQQMDDDDGGVPVWGVVGGGGVRVKEKDEMSRATVDL
jgi:hypothetical protein